jgi:hypothetical protein
VRCHLDYCSFRDFCSYNVHTEGTAWLCWQRLTELAQQVPALCGQHVKDFRRIADDEERHRQVFKILADTLTNGDRLCADVTPQSLSAHLEAARQDVRPEGYRLLPAASARVVPNLSGT